MRRNVKLFFFFSFSAATSQPRRADPAVGKSPQGEPRRVRVRPQGDDLLRALAVRFVDGAPNFGPQAREEGHLRAAAQQGFRRDEQRLRGSGQCE